MVAIDKKKRLNIVFLGEDAFSNIVLKSLIDAGHNISLVITPYYENLIYKKLEHTCLINKINFERCRKINSEETYQLVRYANPDMCVISHFEYIIKNRLLHIPPMGFVNLHPSLLPNYRGLSPQHWPIINGDKEAGITVHYVDEGTDTGNIILQRRFPLYGNEYVKDLQKIWMREYKTIMVEAIDKILNGDETIKQSHLDGSYYGRLTEDDCMIDIQGSVCQAYNIVRGVSMPYHGAQIENLIVWEAHPCNDNIKVSLELGVHIGTEIGDIIKFKDGILFIDKYIQQ